MKAKESVNITLEQLDQEAKKQQAEKEREEMDKRQNNAKPALIKRIGIGLLDFIFAGIIMGACFLFSYFVLFEPLGYNAASEKIISTYQDSGLFVLNEGKFISISEKFDAANDPVAYYDVPITNYYKNDARAVANHKLETYIQAKLDSTYFVLDGENNCVPKEGIGTLVLKETLERELENAIGFFYENPELNDAAKTTYNIVIYSVLISVTIGSVAMYIIVPLIDKQRRTLAYIICGLKIVNKDTMQIISLGRAMLRNGSFIILIYISAVTLYMLTNQIFFSTIPLFINTIFMCLFHTNNGFHDIIGECNVINKTYSNAVSELETIKEMGEQQ